MLLATSMNRACIVNAALFPCVAKVPCRERGLQRRHDAVKRKVSRVGNRPLECRLRRAEHPLGHVACTEDVQHGGDAVEVDIEQPQEPDVAGEDVGDEDDAPETSVLVLSVLDAEHICQDVGELALAEVFGAAKMTRSPCCRLPLRSAEQLAVVGDNLEVLRGNGTVRSPALPVSPPQVARIELGDAELPDDGGPITVGCADGDVQVEADENGITGAYLVAVPDYAEMPLGILQATAPALDAHQPSRLDYGRHFLLFVFDLYLIVLFDERRTVPE